MIASQLKRMGFKDGQKVTRQDLENACDRVPGMDRRTHNRYIGFSIYSRGKERRIVKRVKGYLERLRIAYPIGRGFFKICLAAVPAEYMNETEHTITNLCVPKGSGGSHKIGMEKELVAPTTYQQTTTTQHTHKSQIGESDPENSIVEHSEKVKLTSLEKAILRVSEKEGDSHG